MNCSSLYGKLTLALLMLCCMLSAAAQSVNDFNFIHIGQNEGMYSQRVYSIVQTKDKALWWSTKHGVDRYNGDAVKNYSLGKSNLGDFGGRTIYLKQYVTADKTNKLLAYDDKGLLYEFDPVHDEFRLMVNLRTLMGEEVLLNDVLPTQNGLWIAMREGIYFMSGENLTAVMKGVMTNCIVSTPRQLLFGTKNGLLAYNIAKGEKKDVKSERMQVVIPDAVESGCYDSIYNKVWLGCFHGAVKILSQGKGGIVSDVVTTVDMSGIQNHPVRSICAYDGKTMLVGADGGGVWCANRQSDAAGRYTGRLLFDANDGPQGVLHGNGIYAVMVDSWGSIIMGSYSGGIDVARPVGSTPAIFRHERGTDQSLLNDRVNCVAQMPTGNMIMGTDNGVSIYSPSSHRWKHLLHGVVIKSFCKSPRGTLLASTYGHGVYELSETGAQQLYVAGDGVLRDNYVYSLFYDSKGNLWIGCLDGDLVQVSATGCKYYKLNNVHDIIQLPDGRVAVGTAYGLWTIDSQTGEVRQLNYRKSKDDDVNLYVTTLYVSGKELWIGTDGGGIYVFDMHSHHTTHISSADGLPADYISSIIKDKRNRIMVATERGLAYVSQQTPREVIDVNYCYGVNREYSEGAVCVLNGGNILYGSTMGALIVNPSNIQKLNYTARLNLLGIRCEENDDDKFLERVDRMLHNGRLFLKYGQRTFDLYFEAINLRNQYDIAYQYQMGNGPWSKLDTQQFIRFTNLEPGSHKLRLRCVSRSCGEVLDEVQLVVSISQPWWNSWWMWIIYIALIVSAFWGAWHVYGLHTKYMRLVVSYSKLMSAHDEDAEEQEPEKEQAAHEEDDSARQFVEQATHHVLEHLSDSSFGIDELCREMAMSRTLFYVRLKSYTGQSPQDFVRIIRLERAAALLRSGRTVTEAATMTGFDNPKYFSTVFKKYFSTSPSKYC